MTSTGNFPFSIFNFQFVQCSLRILLQRTALHSFFICLNRKLYFSLRPQYLPHVVPRRRIIADCECFAIGLKSPIDISTTRFLGTNVGPSDIRIWLYFAYMGKKRERVFPDERLAVCKNAEEQQNQRNNPIRYFRFFFDPTPNAQRPNPK